MKLNLIERVIDALADGEYHPIAEVQKGLRVLLDVEEYKIASVLDFLHEYGFIDIDNTEKKVKANRSTLTLIELRAE